MSNRTLIELNHDHCPRNDAECLALGRALQSYMRSLMRDQLPDGVEWKRRRHHSDPDPMAAIDTATKVWSGQRVKAVAEIPGWVFVIPVPPAPAGRPFSIAVATWATLKVQTDG